MDLMLDRHGRLRFDTTDWSTERSRRSSSSHRGAIVLWSASGTQRRTLPRLIGMLGLVAGIAVIAAFVSGHVGLHVHGFGLIMLVEGIWFVSVAVWMLRRSSGLKRVTEYVTREIPRMPTLPPARDDKSSVSVICKTIQEGSRYAGRDAPRTHGQDARTP